MIRRGPPGNATCTTLAPIGWVMEIRFVSSLAPEDETRLAGAVMDAMSTLLDILPIDYSLVVETASGKTFERAGSPRDPVGATAEPRHRGPAARRESP